MSGREFAVCGIICLVMTGCSTTKQSNTARTAREQLLISNAVDQALSKIDFSALNGQKIFLEEKYLECSDKGYVVSSIRHRAMYNGAEVVGKPEDADIVLELRSGGVGTDMSDSYVGIPEIVLPGMMTLPQVKFITRTNQSAIAKIGLMAYDAKSNHLLGSGGVSSALSDDNNWYVLGMGPYQNGTLGKDLDHSLQHTPDQPSQRLPAHVAFQAPDNTPDGNSNRLQLTGDENVE